MVIDIRNRSHRPKGLPARVAGTYEPAGATAGDDDLAQTARRATDAVRRGIVAYAAV